MYLDVEAPLDVPILQQSHSSQENPHSENSNVNIVKSVTENTTSSTAQNWQVDEFLKALTPEPVKKLKLHHTPGFVNTASTPIINRRLEVVAKNTNSSVINWWDFSLNPSSILNGFSFCISHKLLQYNDKLNGIISTLGGTSMGSVLNNGCTHFLHRSSSSDESFLNVRSKFPSIHIVSPYWLRQVLTKFIFLVCDRK